jgi:hypothetical protein
MECSGKGRQIATYRWAIAICALLVAGGEPESDSTWHIIINARFMQWYLSHYYLLNSPDSHVSKSTPRKRLARSANVSPDAAEGICVMSDM